MFRKDPESGEDNSDTDKRDDVVDPRDIYTTSGKVDIHSTAAAWAGHFFQDRSIRDIYSRTGV